MIRKSSRSTTHFITLSDIGIGICPSLIWAANESQTFEGYFQTVDYYDLFHDFRN